MIDIFPVYMYADMPMVLIEFVVNIMIFIVVWRGRIVRTKQPLNMHLLLTYFSINRGANVD